MGTTEVVPLSLHHPAVPCDRAFRSVTMLQIPWVQFFLGFPCLGTYAVQRLIFRGDLGYNPLLKDYGRGQKSKEKSWALSE